MTSRDKANSKSADRLVALTVDVTIPELSALSRAAVIVTSDWDVPPVRAAERGLRKVRQAAKQHPVLPTECKEQS
ncbi:hypothetical protein [Actinokineospora xionganensis]|uniref:NYN domain-containing protein n=1 Tax=Actinokineospora xionganensis TaxID=2684470 RepID=A0ABR7LGN0_9PSEU|nr:hypothetical protein [Actinokineospora xionganensis]MBC6451643.1 hypothetical protein [Actinokineospora xionganensis]